MSLPQREETLPGITNPSLSTIMPGLILSLKKTIFKTTDSAWCLTSKPTLYLTMWTFGNVEQLRGAYRNNSNCVKQRLHYHLSMANPVLMAFHFMKASIWTHFPLTAGKLLGRSISVWRPSRLSSLPSPNTGRDFKSVDLSEERKDPTAPITSPKDQMLQECFLISPTFYWCLPNLWGDKW